MYLALTGRRVRPQTTFITAGTVRAYTLWSVNHPPALPYFTWAQLTPYNIDLCSRSSLSNQSSWVSMCESLCPVYIFCVENILKCLRDLQYSLLENVKNQYCQIYSTITFVNIKCTPYLQVLYYKRWPIVLHQNLICP